MLNLEIAGSATPLLGQEDGTGSSLRAFVDGDCELSPAFADDKSLSVKPRHAAALALLYWILFLDTSPDRHGFDEWSGNFSSKQKCEDALKREQTHWYDGSPEQPNSDEPNIHVHGKHSFWVRRLPGFCESSEVFESPASGWYVIVPPDRCEDRTRDDIDICAKVPNSDAPLSQWLPTWPNYRTAEECERVLNMNRNALILNAADRQLEKAELAAERCVRSEAIHGK